MEYKWAQLIFWKKGEKGLQHHQAEHQQARTASPGKIPKTEIMKGKNAIFFLFLSNTVGSLLFIYREVNICSYGLQVGTCKGGQPNHILLVSAKTWQLVSWESAQLLLLDVTFISVSFKTACECNTGQFQKVQYLWFLCQFPTKWLSVPSKVLASENTTIAFRWVLSQQGIEDKPPAAVKDSNVIRFRVL